MTIRVIRDINFFFWRLHSNNLLYPREDKNERKLMFACRNCEYQEQAENVCVYRHEIVHAPSYV